MLISNLGALGMDTKKKRPLLADKGTGAKNLDFENENGEIRRGSPKGPKVYKFTASLANGMDIDFESDRDLTDDEIQGLVNEYSKTPGYQQAAQKYAKDKKGRDNTPASELGPFDNRRVQEIAANKKLENELIRKTTQGLARAGYNPALTPAEDPRSGFQKALVGDSETSRLLSEDATNLVNDPINTSLGKALGTGGLLGPALRMFGANQQADALEGFLSSAANPANLSGIAPLMQGLANPADAADELVYNAFNEKLPWEKRAETFLNMAVLLAAHVPGAKVGGITVTERVKDAAMAYREARTPIARKALEDAIYTARQTAAPIKGVPDPLKPAPELPIKRTQVGPSPMQTGPMTGATVAGRRPNLRAVPVEPTGVADRGTRTILNRSAKLTAQQEAEAAANRLKNPTPPMKALPGRTPEPAPVAVQPKPEAPAVVSKAAEPKVETPAPTPKEPAAAKGKEPWEMTLAENNSPYRHDWAKSDAKINNAARFYFSKLPAADLFSSGFSKKAIQEMGVDTAPLDKLLKDLPHLAEKKQRYDSLESWVSATKSLTIAKAKELGGITQDIHSQYKRVQSDADGASRRIMQVSEAHKNAVEQALKEGKPVPASVLADYPDLAAKYKPGAPKPVAKVETPVVAPKTPEQAVSPIDKPIPLPKQGSPAIARSVSKVQSALDSGEIEVAIGDDLVIHRIGKTQYGVSHIGWDSSAVTKNGMGSFVKTGKETRELVAKGGDLSELMRGQVTPANTKIWSDWESYIQQQRAKLKPKQDVTPPADATPKTGLDAVIQAGEDASARLKKGGTGNKNRQRGALGITPEDLKDLTIVVAGRLAKGAKTFQEVAAHIKKEFPAHYEAFVRNGQKIYTDAKVMHSDNMDRVVRAPSKATKANVSTETKLGNPNEKAINEGVRDVQEGQGKGNEGKQFQGQGNGQKANAFVQEKGQVTPESVGVKSAKLNETQPAVLSPVGLDDPLKQSSKVEPTPAALGADPQPGTPTRFAASNAASNDIRQSLGYDKLDDAGKRKWDDVLGSATQTYDADAVDARIKDASKPLTDVETAQAGMRSAELAKKLKTATGDTYDDLEKKLLDHTIALRDAGTEQGRALAARNMAVLEDYSLDGMYRRYVGASKAKSAAEIPADVRQTIKRLSDSHDELTQRIGVLQKRFDEQATKLAEAERVRITKEVQTRGTRKAATKATRDELVSRIRKNQSQYISSVPIQGLIDSADDIKALVKLTIEDGITDLSEVYKAVSGHLKKGGVDLTRSEFDGVLAGAYKKTPGLKRDLTEYQNLLKEARESGAGKDALIWQRVRRLDERIKAQQYDNLKATPIGKALTDAEIALKAKQVEFDRLKTQAKVKAEFDALSPAGKAGRTVLETTNAIRSVVASTDVSAPLNQGFFYTLSHPGKSASAIWETMGAIKGDDALNRIMGKIRNNPYYELGKGSKLQVGAAAGDYADDFMTFGDSKAAKLLTGKYSPIGASERAYKAYVTKIRMDMFADLAKAEERAAGGRLKRSDYEAISEFVNTVTGTTTNKTVQAVSKPAGAILFAPKYTVARIKTVFATPAINAARVGNYRLAGRILGEYAKVAGAIGGAVYIANQNGANVELDPRSPKFMKGRIGNVEFNADQGLGQTYKIVAQLLNPALDRIPGLPPVRGKKSSAFGALDTYVSGKLAPAPKMLKNVIDGKAYGKSYDVSKQEGWMNLGLSLLPISVQGGADLAKRTDISNEQKAAIGLAGFLGVKIDAEPPRTK